MPLHSLQDFIRRLRRARSVMVDGHLSDAELLERFASQHDEAAFEVLVWRHGTLVLNVARRLLREAADAEDVFQATFLTLARKASAIRRGTALGSWLYKVAYRLALRVRQAAPSRRPQANLDNVAAPVEQVDGEESALLAEEVNRLPERYRAVVVLCYLQGATTAEAARLLGCPRGTVLSRLASARQRLRQRLLRRGVAPALAVVSFGATASAAPSAASVACVVAAALPFAAGRAVVESVSPQVAALAQGALQTMLWNKIKIVVAMTCLIALTGSGVGWLTRGQAGAERNPPTAEPPAKKDAPRAAAPDRQKETEKEIEELTRTLDVLEQQERQSEEASSAATIEIRLDLLELQYELHQREETLKTLREERQERLKLLQRQIRQMEEIIADDTDKTPGVEYPGLRKAREEKKALSKKLDSLRKEEEGSSKGLRDLRKQIFRAEEQLHRIEARLTRRRDDFARQREMLQARLQQLQTKALDREPADRLREVERKLDALRRDVKELRRTLERQKER